MPYKLLNLVVRVPSLALGPSLVENPAPYAFLLVPTEQERWSPSRVPSLVTLPTEYESGPGNMMNAGGGGSCSAQRAVYLLRLSLPELIGETIGVYDLGIENQVPILLGIPGGILAPGSLSMRGLRHS